MSKPSERINALIAQLNKSAITVLRASIAAEARTLGEATLTDEEFAEFVKSPEAAVVMASIEISFGIRAITEELDREDERRAAWEKRIESALNLPPETP